MKRGHLTFWLQSAETMIWANKFRGMQPQVLQERCIRIRKFTEDHSVSLRFPNLILAHFN